MDLAKFSNFLDQKKKELDEDLKSLEKNIFDLEGRYLDNTVLNGNVLKGWDNFLNNKGSRHTIIPIKRNKIMPLERLFSLSSMSSLASE